MRTLLRGGTIRALVPPVDRRRPSTTAMAVDGDTVTWIGSEDGAGAYAEHADEVIDLRGSLVTPAFVDAHVHATSTGLALEGLDLSSTASLGAALAAVERAGRLARGGIVLGHGWDETRWPERRPPTRHELDRASYGGVVYLSRIDVHSAVVSSALLAAAPEAWSAPGFRDDGWLTTEAHHLVRRVARESLSPAQRTAAHRGALRRASQLGIGCVHELAGPDISGAEDLSAILALADAEPGPEVVGYWGELGGAERARELGARGAAGDLFADGAIGSRSAALRTVYADAATSGHSYLTAAQVRDHVVAATVASVQAGFHAIGDAALDAVAAGFDEAAAVLGDDAVRAARHRVEHVEMIDAAGIAIFARLGIVASVQPAFDRLWGGSEGMYAQRLGTHRAAGLNPFATMRTAGVVLAFGSDAPVTPLDPWGTVRAAMHHHVARERLDAEVAFAAHTAGGWHAADRDGEGTLRPGAAATYAVWDVEGPLVGLLPRLDLDAPLPRCRRTTVRGVTTFVEEHP